MNNTEEGRQNTPLYTGSHVLIDGDVRFGQDVSVWHNGVIRTEDEPVRIGDRTNIQDGCVIHTDEGYPVTIGNDVTIGHRAIVHGATIEDGVLIGMGAIIMNGARIGKGSIIGAGALVSENKVIEPGSLALGMPARVIRKLGEQEYSANLASADHYVRIARQKRFGKDGE